MKKEFNLHINLEVPYHYFLVMDSKERLAKQRNLLNKRLGLDMAEKLGLDTSDICCNEDLLLPKQQTPNKTQLEEIKKKAVAEIVKAEMAQLSPGLSSREINKAKRKAKLVAKQRSKDNQELNREDSLFLMHSDGFVDP
uniref:Uncharacterized protein n=1 Tax=Strigamia maritima TaxID=126957 RepID=T1JN62_STRMM